MELKVFTNKLINEAHAYLIIKNNKAVLIDTGCSSEEIIEYSLNNNIQITDVFLSHSHFDHLLGLNEIAKIFKDLKIYIGQADFKNVFSAKRNFSLSKKNPYVLEKSLNFIPLKNKQEIVSTLIGNVNYYLMGGHSKGTAFFKIEELLFVGDTLFLETLGFHNKRMPGCNIRKFNKSLIWIVNNSFGLTIYAGHRKAGFKIEDVLNNKDHQIYKENIIKIK
ncbi:hydroxyacylglutathione hydrolase [Spiroplasma sp. TIUS-1]|uniref:MBL fold metallo-hydrolase n=1 Tax=Spiroplasma sp. TIUS-1 TaxID=216963 RepID=UPI00139829D7|nr:MBL fold metallo-hydrolase [Spiroplasma sp. TIUS-1]QHX36132.1 hydroxyacylglutathione hydrolase [Spiroplasma sp. TIUS-1]